MEVSRPTSCWPSLDKRIHVQEGMASKTALGHAFKLVAKFVRGSRRDKHIWARLKGGRQVLPLQTALPYWVNVIAHARNRSFVLPLYMTHLFGKIYLDPPIHGEFSYTSTSAFGVGE